MTQSPPDQFRGPVRRELHSIVIVQQKRLSRKMSWTTYGPAQRLGHDAKPADKHSDAGRPFRFHYRINVYEKVFN